MSFYHQAPVSQEFSPEDRPADAALVIKQSEALLLSRERGELIVGLVGTGDKEFLAVEDGSIGLRSERAQRDRLGGGVQERGTAERRVGVGEETGVVEVGDAAGALVYADYQVIEGDGVVGGDEFAKRGEGFGGNCGGVEPEAVADSFAGVSRLLRATCVRLPRRIQLSW